MLRCVWGVVGSFTAEFDGEWILKINQHLAKLGARIFFLVFWLTRYLRFRSNAAPQSRPVCLSVCRACRCWACVWSRPNVCSYRDVELTTERRPCNKTYTRMVRVWKPNCRGPATYCLGYQRRSVAYLLLYTLYTYLLTQLLFTFSQSHLLYNHTGLKQSVSDNSKKDRL